MVDGDDIIETYEKNSNSYEKREKTQHNILEFFLACEFKQVIYFPKRCSR